MRVAPNMTYDNLTVTVGGYVMKSRSGVYLRAHRSNPFGFDRIDLQEVTLVHATIFSESDVASVVRNSHRAGKNPMQRAVSELGYTPVMVGVSRTQHTSITVDPLTDREAACGA